MLNSNSSNGSHEWAPAEISVAILAGGLGTRLRSVVGQTPKVIAEVGGRPALAWLLDQLDTHGFHHVVLCTGHRADAVSARLGDRHGRLQLHYSAEPEPLGTGGALRRAFLQLASDPVLVLNGDSFCDVDLGQFVRVHQARHAPVSLVVTELADTRRFGRVSIRPDGRIEQFLEKSDATGPGWINAGIYLLSRQQLTAIPVGRPVSLESELLPAWLPQGVYGFPARGNFLDIGTPESFARAGDFFAERPARAA